MLSILSTCGRAIVEVLFPSCCPVCGKKLLQEEQIICCSCIASICRTEHANLYNNGIDMLFADLLQAETKKIHYEHGAAWAYYNRERGKVFRNLVERGKFGRSPNPLIFYALGRVAAQEYVDSDLFDDIDCIVPIPLHPCRLRERGFNQTEYICKGLSEVLRLPIDTTHLVRVRNNSHQSHASFDERSENVKNLFSVHYPEEWKGKHILLVDDVITSGATMMACMRTLASIRGCKISVFSLGWAHH